MTDLTDFGVEEPRDPADEPEADGDEEPSVQWSECVDCGHVGRDVTGRLNQSVPLCSVCFVEREGLQ